MPTRALLPEIVLSRTAFIRKPCGKYVLGYCRSDGYIEVAVYCHSPGTVLAHELIHWAERLLTGCFQGHGQGEYRSQHCEQLASGLEDSVYWATRSSMDGLILQAKESQ